MLRSGPRRHVEVRAHTLHAARDVSWRRAAGPGACDAVGAGARRRGRARV